MNFWKRSMPFFAAMAVTALAAVAITPGARAQAAKAANPQEEADQKEIHDYVLTMDKIGKLGAVQKDFEALEKSNPDLAKDVGGGDSEDKSIDQLVQRINKYPQVTTVLKKDGLTPREYIVGTLTLIQAGTAVAFKRAGTYKDYPPEMLKLVSQANLTLLEQHWDDVTKAMPVFADSGDGK